MSGRTEVVVTGAGVLSPLGDTPWEMFAALCRGDVALAPVEGFKPEEVDLDPALLIAAEMRGFDPREYLGRKNFRPLDRTGRLAAVAAQLALDGSGWTPEVRKEHEVGLVLGTMFGSVHTISAFDRRALVAGPNYAKPMDFANSVINAAAGQTAIWHDLRGVNTTLSGGNTAGLQALGYATDLVRGGGARAVLAGGADELCFESFLGFARAGWLAGSANGGSAKDSPPRPIPLHARRNGFAAGEGAALLVLESQDSATARGAAVRGRVLGYGTAFDPSRGGDDDSAREALERAVRLALDDAGLQPSDVDLLSLSANGSVAGDRREARALAAVLGDRLREIPALAVKGQLGEALGASGGFQTLAALSALQEGRVPGVPGLDEPQPDLLLPSLATAEREVGAPGAPYTALVTALDFDGSAVALLLGAP